MLTATKNWLVSWIPVSWRVKEGKAVTFSVAHGSTDMRVIISSRVTPEDVAKLLVRISLGMETTKILESLDNNGYRDSSYRLQNAVAKHMSQFLQGAMSGGNPEGEKQESQSGQTSETEEAPLIRPTQNPDMK